jgi:hypothetical protein
VNKFKVGLVLASIACLCAAFAASASAFTEFTAKSPNAAIKDVNKGTHTFSIPGASSPVECTVVKSSGTATKTKSATQQTVVAYSSCTAFGFLPATVSNADYEFNANGTVTQLNTVTIKATGCEVVVEPTGNSNLKAITYTQVAGTNKEVEIKANVSGITEKAPGGICGNSGKEATYKGTSIVSSTGVDIGIV